MRRLWIRVPASAGNMGPGFDAIGAALGLYNEIEVIRRPGKNISVRIEGEGAGELSRSGNLVLGILKGLGGLELRMVNRIPLGRGLGSSGAARLAAHAARLSLLGRPISGALQAAAADEGHADNAAASYHGGLAAAVWDRGTLLSLNWPAPRGVSAVVCVPDFPLPTSQARAVLPARVPRRDAVENLGRLALLLGAWSRGRPELLAAAMEDRLHQPYRRRLIPGFERVRESARKAGALGTCLSGAGSSILAVAGPRSDPARIGRAMERAFLRSGVGSRAMRLSFDGRGLRLES